MSGTWRKLWPKHIHKFLKNSKMSFMSFIRKSWAKLDKFDELLFDDTMLWFYCF